MYMIYTYIYIYQFKFNIICRFDWMTPFLFFIIDYKKIRP